MPGPFRGAAAVLLLLAAAPAVLGGPGPQPAPRPRPGQKDWQLYEKAVRLQAGMWWHLSPEGVLVYEHRPGATLEQLSHDATLLSDVAIWTGCYAASQACRWHVTGDPDALEQCRVLAQGLAALSDVTGVPGCLARNLGRPLAGERRGERSEPSPSMEGVWFRGDASRDQLAGVVLGWGALARFVPEDEGIRALARAHMTPIAKRLHRGNMWLRDRRGGKTEHGELRPDVELLPFVRNGPFASIGLATLRVAEALDRGDAELDRMERRLRQLGWADALPSQFTWMPSLVTASNANMVNLSLLTLALYGDDNDVAGRARRGLGALRGATRGWWNGGACACQLLAGLADPGGEILGELRAALHDLTDLEVPPCCPRHLRLDRPATTAEKGVTDWTWKDEEAIARVYPPGAPPAPVQYTRADYLFAYWLARAAGHLRPLVGEGSEPRAHRVPVRRPPWTATPAAPPP